MKEWKKRIMGAQSLDDLCETLNKAEESYESETDNDNFQSYTGLSGKDWSNLPVFGPYEWALPQGGLVLGTFRGNVLVHGSSGEILGKYDTPWAALHAFERAVPDD